MDQVDVVVGGGHGVVGEGRVAGDVGGEVHAGLGLGLGDRVPDVAGLVGELDAVVGGFDREYHHADRIRSFACIGVGADVRQRDLGR